MNSFHKLAVSSGWISTENVDCERVLIVTFMVGVCGCVRKRGWKGEMEGEGVYMCVGVYMCMCACVCVYVSVCREEERLEMLQQNARPLQPLVTRSHRAMERSRRKADHWTTL